MSQTYIIGIDLGTTNCGLAWADPSEVADPHSLPPVHRFEIPQLVHPGEVREEPLLPSFLYLPGPADFPEGSLALPWDGAPKVVVGALARARGVESAGRLVSSAKSWLSHAGVDRSAALLPPHAPAGVERLSAVEASRAYLAHLKQAWDHRMPGAPFDRQQVLVTVPASFDAAARDLTLKAAAEAGYGEVVLLEEPQAAFYAWIERNPGWREQVKEGDLILVIDIGGGTTDFTLISVTSRDGELSLERVAVGEHILLGGDNMDLALARLLAEQLAAKGTRLDSLQLHALWQQCRAAKEKLLDAEAGTKEEPVTILGRGTGLVGGAIRAKLKRAEVESQILDGFLPAVSSHESPQRQRRAALAEIGLPYASDPAITRHLAGFLRQGSLAAPTHVLFNGGVLKSAAIRKRLLEVLNGWLREEGRPEAAPLVGEDLMHAVARGAAYYGMARRGKGVRIRGGIARTYYVGIETAMPAVPGMPAPLKALCVAPFGMEEGARLSFPEREFGLVVGEPAEFRFLSSTTRRTDEPGVLLEDYGEEIQEISPMEVCLEGRAGEMAVVTLESVVTETGVLQLWCVARDGRRWKLEFNVRERVPG